MKNRASSLFPNSLSREMPEYDSKALIIPTISPREIKKKKLKMWNRFASFKRTGTTEFKSNILRNQLRQFSAISLSCNPTSIWPLEFLGEAPLRTKTQCLDWEREGQMPVILKESD
jgi:hypothetical protein